MLPPMKRNRFFYLGVLIFGQLALAQKATHDPHGMCHHGIGKKYNHQAE